MISLKDVRRLTKYLDATSDQLLLGCTKPPIDLSGLTEDQIEEIFIYYKFKEIKPSSSKDQYEDK